VNTQGRLTSAGFSAFFTKLHKGVQDEIINRTLQSFGQG
jgi:pyruvate-formate lyase